LPEKNNNKYFFSVVVLLKILFPHKKNKTAKPTQNKPQNLIQIKLSLPPEKLYSNNWNSRPQKTTNLQLANNQNTNTQQKQLPKTKTTHKNQHYKKTYSKKKPVLLSKSTFLIT